MRLLPGLSGFSALYFNSRTHVECDRYASWVQNVVRISTHALTWSATLYHILFEQGSAISTHALTWSATADEYLIDLNRVHFNSRTHVECDAEQSDQHRFLFHFNSRTHVECDRNLSLRIPPLQISTHALTWSATHVNR